MRLAYVFLPCFAAVNATPFILEAMHSVAPGLLFEMLPSSQGAMLLRFLSHPEREVAMGLRPIIFEGTHVELERCEESSNRFFKKPEWLAYLSVKEFPPEQWFEETIKKAFTYFGTVVEIDHRNLNHTDFSSLRITVEMEQ